MKLDYEYKVQLIDNSGVATVEYKNAFLGTITRVFVIPYDRGDAEIRRTIIEKFPKELFYSRHLARNPNIDPKTAKISGKMSLDFDDYFYDVQEIVAETIVLNEQTNH